MRRSQVFATIGAGLAAVAASGTAALAAPATTNLASQAPADTHLALGYTAAGLILAVGAASLITIARLRRTAHVAAHASR